MNDREKLATRIETNPLGWLPGVGDAINITFTPDEARVLIAALRSAPQRGDAAASLQKTQTTPQGEARRERLEDIANELRNDFGHGAWQDGITRSRLEQIEKQIASLPPSPEDRTEGREVREALVKMLAAWDALPIGSHKPREVNNWLCSDQWIGAVDAARAALSPLGRDAVMESKFSPGDPVEIRKQNDAIDEIVIRRGDVHIEQMSADGWFMGVDGSDGSYWQFWFGAKNGKAAVEFRHVETVGAEEDRAILRLVGRDAVVEDWQSIETAPESIRLFAKMIETDESRNGFIEYCGTIADGRPFVLLRKDAIGQIFDRYFILPHYDPLRALTALPRKEGCAQSPKEIVRS